ncbi:MAG: ABC transporter ATP-binding protein [Vicinamibacterales bacterium]
MSAMVSIEGVGKRYLLHHRPSSARYETLRDAVADAAAAPFRWFNGAPRAASATEDFWALRDVSFDVGRGEVVGIIGPNGAGKSTLLKILSRITDPTAGRITLHGRVASLLEVGTGFHPELSGRENIFLNGSILGMSRAEIVRKFDAIVTFAGVETFLDTPVKRFSSGMYVRLAFAVAAHLEPEVLVVDEVLAVGDIEFQQRSLGKMQEVSRGGRTVLFVSHNMAAINSLTTRTVLLDRGRMIFDGPTGEAIGRYVQLAGRATASVAFGRGAHSAVISAQLMDGDDQPTAQYTPGLPLRLEVVFETDGRPGLSLEMFLVDALQQKIAMASLHHFEGIVLPETPGRYRTTLDLQPVWLASGAYSIDVTTSIVNSSWDHYVDNAAALDVVLSNPGGRPWDFKHDFGYGAFALPCARVPEFVPEPHDGR